MTRFRIRFGNPLPGVLLALLLALAAPAPAALILTETDIWTFEGYAINYETGEYIRHTARVRVTSTVEDDESDPNYWIFRYEFTNVDYVPESILTSRGEQPYGGIKIITVFDGFYGTGYRQPEGEPPKVQGGLGRPFYYGDFVSNPPFEHVFPLGEPLRAGQTHTVGLRAELPFVITLGWAHLIGLNYDHNFPLVSGRVPVPGLPEPSSFSLLGIGAATLAVLRLRRRSSAKSGDSGQPHS